MAEILVVEDDEDIALLVGSILRRAGHRVAAVGTVGAALAALESASFDVIVTDLGLPDASGSVVCEAAAARGARVVVITANPKLAEVPPIRECAEVVLAKPFDPDVLRDVVDGRL